MTARKDSPMLLMILDGWGCSSIGEGNATLQAKLPNMRKFTENYPSTVLKASGPAVGLPEGQMGNSEVGHLNIGAGRVVYQEYTRISKAISDGSFMENQVLAEGMSRLPGTGKALHLLGLLSDGGVHSHIQHLFALLDMAIKLGVEKIYVHPILDGRDVLPRSAKKFISSLENKLKEIGKGQIATVSGRYYTMDRDKRWDRVEKAYKMLTLAEGLMACSALAAVENSYEGKVEDEFVLPTGIVDEKGRPLAVIEDGDSVIFFNFRADRAREITHAFLDDDFTGFERSKRPRVHFICLTEYDESFPGPVAFPPQNLDNTLGEVLADLGYRQLRIAETEKYAHVTFFFNGGVEEPNEGEDRILIPSPKVPTYNLKPEMSAYEVTSMLISKLQENIYDVVILNFANPDMVGHTGSIAATVKALETVDDCLGRIAGQIEKLGGTVIITADHGNAESMIDEKTNSPLTAHTTNPVPFVLVDEKYKGQSLRDGGALCDIAPTFLDILKEEVPGEMTGISLLEHGETL